MCLKVSKSQNKFMKSSFFGRNDDIINLFWDLLTFTCLSKLEEKFLSLRLCKPTRLLET